MKKQSNRKNCPKLNKKTQSNSNKRKKLNKDRYKQIKGL
jgi:hypothetical protein